MSIPVREIISGKLWSSGDRRGEPVQVLIDNVWTPAYKIAYRLETNSVLVLVPTIPDTRPGTKSRKKSFRMFEVLWNEAYIHR